MYHETVLGTEFEGSIQQLDRVPPGRIGEITAVNKDGLAYLIDAASGKKYAFTFDKLQGYYGHKPREIGLKVGTKVYFEALADEIVSVRLPKPALPDLLTIPEVAGWLRVSERLVYNMIKRGDLPHVKVGRLMRVPTEALRALATALAPKS